jgi:hypothetical protein
MLRDLSTTNTDTSIAIRRSRPEDAGPIWLLSLLDTRPMPPAPYLVAEIEGELVAAISLATEAVVADPFRRTADAVALLRLRAAQLGGESEIGERRTRRRLLRPAPAA